MSDNPVINSQVGALDWRAIATGAGKGIRKLTVGRTPGDQGEKKGAPTRLDGLPASFQTEFRTWFPELAELYLWGIDDLCELPDLPPTLKCLDVRGCQALERLPELPPGLETLDLGDCSGLRELPEKPPQYLRRFYFNGCSVLPSDYLAMFLRKVAAEEAQRLERATTEEERRTIPVLEEIDGSETAAVTSLETFPRIGLRKLVLRNCVKLESLANIGQFKALDHLNLAGCTGITKMPDLPPAIRYLELEGAEQLSDFMGQGVSRFDLGGTDKNVAKRFKTRKKFGRGLALTPHAKLLLLGDGRVGKTTLAKRLQWEELDAATRCTEAGLLLKPCDGEPYTHKIQMQTWSTGLDFDQKTRRDIKDRVTEFNKSAEENRRIEIPLTHENLIRGNIRLWDFGGQDIYHQTHKVFAREGSVFLIVWCEKPHRVEEERPEGVDPTEFREWNRQRPLEYWHDYIRSLFPQAEAGGPKPRIALVCTGVRQGMKQPPAPDWALSEKLPCFYLDSLEGAVGKNPQYQQLVTWIREACAAKAHDIGVIQPRFYQEVMNLVDRMLEEDKPFHVRKEDAPHALKTWKEWSQSIQTAHAQTSLPGGPVLEKDDIVSITDYLDAAGNIFKIRGEDEVAVLVDQQWGTGLIYEMLKPNSHLFNLVRTNGGWFTDDDLAKDRLWKPLDSFRRRLLIDYMITCHIVAPLTEQRASKSGAGRIHLATNKWLLPSFQDLGQHCHDRIKSIRAQSGMVLREVLEVKRMKVSEPDFRVLFASLAAYFADTGVYFRNGLIAAEPNDTPQWFVSLSWKEEHEGAYHGELEALISTPLQQLNDHVEQLKSLIFAADGPLAAHRHLLRRRELHDTDLETGTFLGRRPGDYDLGISSSGGDNAAVGNLKQALKQAGFLVTHYREERFEEKNEVELAAYMERLSEQRCLLLFLSESYLQLNPDKWYCAYELADAMIQMGDGRTAENGELRKRDARHTPVIIQRQGNFELEQVDGRISELLQQLENHFVKKYAALATADDRRRHPNLARLQKVFAEALKDNNFLEFMARRSNLGSVYHLDELTGAHPPFADLIRDLLGIMLPRGARKPVSSK